jgi:hypothetical protein
MENLHLVDNQNDRSRPKTSFNGGSRLMHEKIFKKTVIPCNLKNKV